MKDLNQFNYETLIKLEDLLNIELGKMTEDQLFNLLKETVWNDLTHTINKFDRCDTEFKDGSGGCELKCRRSNYSTLRIEKDKYDHLMNNYKRSYYICSTPTGIFGFNLNKIDEPTWELTYNPKTTDFTNKEMVQKWTFDIPVTQDNNLTNLIYKRIILNK